MQHAIGIRMVVVGMVVACVNSTDSLSAQEPMPLTRLPGPIVFDGRVDEAAWDEIPVLPMTVFTPTFGGGPTERTEIRVAYDDSHLYVAGRLYDSDPDGIRVGTLYRDRYSGDDILGIMLDSFNDNETAVWFVTNPAGARTDRTISNDGESANGSFMNPNWNTFWDVLTTRNEEGWFAEMRIPFSSLGFQDNDGRVEMGMGLYRVIARSSERHIFPAIPPDWGSQSYAKPSQFKRISLEGVHTRKPVYVTPYVLGGVNRFAEPYTARSVYVFDNRVTREAGVDVKYNVSANLTLDLTANTDFAQVESDSLQVNLTRFSLFFPEKRQFFQERDAVFEFNTGGLSRLFHSRKIGLDGGRPMRIYGGARLVGRIGGTDIGVLSMQTDAAGDISAENFGVLRLRQRVLNAYSTVGGIVTTRVGNEGSYNVAVGVDGIIRAVGDEYVTLKFAHTLDDKDPSDLSLPDRGRIVARWERRKQSGLGYSADFIRSGRAYAPDLGFQLRSDFTFVQNEVQYLWLRGERSPFRTIAVRNTASTYIRNGDKTAESGSVQPKFTLELKNGSKLEFSTLHSYESVRDTFSLSGGTDVPPGDYWFHAGTASFVASHFTVFRPAMTVSAGSFYDGWNTTVQAGPAWNLSSHLELSATYQFNMIRFSDRDLSLNAHLALLRIEAAANVHLSLSAFLQYNSTTDVASASARVRYHFSEGRDFWLVYDEGLNTERDLLGGPRLPLSQNRAAMVKYTHTLIW